MVALPFLPTLVPSGLLPTAVCENRVQVGGDDECLIVKGEA